MQINNAYFYLIIAGGTTFFGGIFKSFVKITIYTNDLHFKNIASFDQSDFCQGKSDNVSRAPSDGGICQHVHDQVSKCTLV